MSEPSSIIDEPQQPTNSPEFGTLEWLRQADEEVGAFTGVEGSFFMEDQGFAEEHGSQEVETDYGSQEVETVATEPIDSWLQSLIEGKGPEQGACSTSSTCTTASASNTITTSESPTLTAGTKRRQTTSRRKHFNTRQSELLLNAWNKNNEPSLDERSELADKMGCEVKRVDVWFKNKRLRYKKSCIPK